MELGNIGNILLARTDTDAAVIVLIILVLFALVYVAVMTANAKEYFWPRKFKGRFRRFFAPLEVKDLQTHEKTFPGYDLASVNLAFEAVLKDRCASAEKLGGAGGSTDITFLLTVVIKPGPPAYIRLPTDVDAEDSFISNCVWLCTSRRSDIRQTPWKGAERFAVLFASAEAPHNGEEEMNSRSGQVTLVKISIACRTRNVADDFFQDVERLRRKLNIFRGKVIDPVVSPAGIRSIGFRRIRPVREEDLVLPEGVKELVRAAVVSFYRHGESLRKLGVEMKRGLLLHSIAGTGKTSISLYLAGLLPDFTVCFVSGRRLLYPRELCSMARYLQPAMLVFEDIDLIAQERDMNGLATVLGELMNQIDGCEPDDQVLFVMNTNSMSRLEQAVRNRPGRVDQIIHIPLPDLTLRRELITRFSANLNVAQEAIARLAEISDGVTPAMLKEVVKRAAVLAVSANHQSHVDSIQISEADLLLAFTQVQALREVRADAGQTL